MKCPYRKKTYYTIQLYGNAQPFCQESIEVFEECIKNECAAFTTFIPVKSNEIHYACKVIGGEIGIGKVDEENI